MSEMPGREAVEMAVQTTKEELYRLVDALPEYELHAARRFLEYLRDVGSDPVLRAFMEAPEDDEPETEEERAAVQEAYEALARGEVRPWAEVRAELLGSTRVARPRKRVRTGA